jgi:hypothetical protein
MAATIATVVVGSGTMVTMPVAWAKVSVWASLASE